VQHVVRPTKRTNPQSHTIFRVFSSFHLRNSFQCCRCAADLWERKLGLQTMTGATTCPAPSGEQVGPVTFSPIRSQAMWQVARSRKGQNLQDHKSDSFVSHP
jgi:hypothetical protein